MFHKGHKAQGNCELAGSSGQLAEDRISDFGSRIWRGIEHRVKDFVFTPCSMPYALCHLHNGQQTTNNGRPFQEA
jgi:hypothetical protein